ncbi:hypothetical protein D3C74_254270 [compost metagenome]
MLCGLLGGSSSFIAGNILFSNYSPNSCFPCRNMTIGICCGTYHHSGIKKGSQLISKNGILILLILNIIKILLKLGRKVLCY